MPKPTYAFKAKLKRVKDGDTVVTLCDQGFRNYREVTLRLEDLNAKEMKDGGQAAKDAAIAWLHEDLVVVTYQDPDIYDRYTARVWNASDPDGETLNEYLVNNNLALYKKYRT